ncbi:flagellin [Natrialbaceae archaeon GCM10025810]|uniref:flagellin n=1 Tax=Halovalidus salilacus TaxID=3075124 RepID=UPI0036209AF3
MSGTSATHLILFIGSLVVASAVTGTVVLEVGQLSDAVDARGDGVNEEIETEIAIISDEAHNESIVDDDGNVTILVKNVGSRGLDVHPTTVDVLIDGGYVSNDRTSVERVDAAGDSWRPGGVVAVTVEPETEPSGDTEIAAVVNGNRDDIDVYA